VIELDGNARDAFRAATAEVDQHIARLVGGNSCTKLRAAAASLSPSRILRAAHA
jgi:hypothetical protein